MATLDDKLLGEKTHYYCSSSESDGASDSESEEACSQPTSSEPQLSPDGSCNTGPKGVLEDWRRFKQLENEKREEQDAERLALIKKLSLTCAPDSEQTQSDELDELLQDEFLLEYTQKRMSEMFSKLNTHSKFGKVLDLKNGHQFLEAVEEKEVTVIVHLYEDAVDSCNAMNGCLIGLAQNYPYVKFCTLKASAAGVSAHFQKSGIPALLVYKGGQLVGNFIRLSDELGDDFFVGDVESFLLQHGMLPNVDAGSTIVSTIR